MNAKKRNLEMNALRPDYAAQVAQIAASNLAPQNIRRQLREFHENDIALALNLLDEQQRQKLYTMMDGKHLADVLSYCEAPETYLDELSISRQAAVLSEMEPADGARYLRRQDKRGRTNLLELIEEGSRREILMLSAFDEDQFGSKMTTNYVWVKTGTGVKQAMSQLVAQAAEHDNISTIYVVEENGAFAGAIDLKDLIIAREGTALEAITMASYPYVYADEEIAGGIERLKDYSEDSIPVLDSAGKLVGALTAQEMTQLVDEQLGDDYAKLGGLAAEEDLTEPLKKSIAKRLPWLTILLGLGLLVSGVVGLFEQVVASLTLVVCFQSLVLDMAGNVGTQSLAITIRVLMDEQLTRKQKLSLVAKEARVGLCNGLILGLLSLGLIGLYLLAKGENAVVAFSVSACTGVALAVSMVLSSICGTVIPLIFRKFRIDPAVASGPLITTVNDLVAVVTYYGLAWILLLRLLPGLRG